jgi:hypothetical protein
MFCSLTPTWIAGNFRLNRGAHADPALFLYTLLAHMYIIAARLAQGDAPL